MSQSKVELIMSAQTTSGTIDLIGDEQINLVLSIADVFSITEKKSPFSQTFTILGSKNNNQLFTSIFEIQADSSFDPRLKTKCYLLVDSIQVMEGNLQLLGISVDNEKGVSYELIIYGETDDFFTNLGEAYLEDLDWSELNHFWTKENIINTWTATTTPYYYPLVDWGYDYDVNDLNGIANGGRGATVDKFFPGLQEAYVVNKIFSAAGYTYDSTFLTGNTTYLNEFLLYNNGTNIGHDPGFSTARTFSASILPFSANGPTYPSGATPGASGFTSSFRRILPFSNDSTNGRFDNGGLYNTTTYKYSADTVSSQRFFVQFGGAFSDNIFGVSQTFYFGVNFYRSSYQSGTVPFWSDIKAQGTGGFSYLFSTPWTNNLTSGTTGSTLYPLVAGEQIWAEVTWDTYDPAYPVKLAVYPNTTFYNNVGQQVEPGQLIQFNKYVPRKIKQKDFMNWMINKYCLYVMPDKSISKKLLIEPRETFYSRGRIITDWKLDLEVPISQELTSQKQPKKFIFSEKIDSDYLNQDYFTRKNLVYGTYIYDNVNEYNVEDKNITIDTSPTPLTNVIGSGQIIVPKIGKLSANNTFGETDANLRILQRNPVGMINAGFPSGDTFVFEYQNFNMDYPYIGHLDHPFSSTTDNNFGQIEYAYYDINIITANNLVNRFWINYLNEIGDKDAKVITCNMYLTPAQINNFNYNDQIYLENLTSEGGCYFKVNSINYCPTSNVSSQVQLIKTNVVTKPIIQGVLPTVGQPTQWTSRTTLNLGDNQIYSKNGIVVGTNNVIGQNSNGTNVFGTNNIIGGGTTNSNINGDNNFIPQGGNFLNISGSGNTVPNTASYILSVGDGNTFGPQANNNFVFGNNNTISSGATGNTVFGNNVTIPSGSSNTLFATNVEIFSSITIGNTVITATGNTSLGIWTGGSGNKSVMLNNNTGNIAAGNGSFNASYGSNVSGNYSAIIGGASNNIDSGSYHSFAAGRTNTLIASSRASVLGGANNIINGSEQSIIVGGGNNLVYGGYQSSILGGGYNSATTTFSSIVGGRYNNNYGLSAIIGNGLSNSVGANYGVVVNGQNNLASQIAIGFGGSSVLNGKENSAITHYSTVINGTKNLASGLNSFVSNGSGNTVASQQGAIVGGVGNVLSSVSTNGFIGGGFFNDLDSADSAILAGVSNRISSASVSANVIVGGRDNFIDSFNSAIIGGDTNNITTFGQANSAIIGGSGNTLSGLYSVMLGGFNMVGTASNTVYMPSIAFSETGATRAFMEISIGAWNMDTTAVLTKNHSLTSTQWKTVRDVQVLIMDDSQAQVNDLNTLNPSGSGAGCGWFNLFSTGFNLTRVTGQYFDDAAYSSTANTRGWITFWYNPNA